MAAAQTYARFEDLPPNLLAARAMLAEDARWAIDLIQSSDGTDAQGLIGLTFARHFVRIVHEGRKLLEAQPVPAGWLDIVPHLTSNHSEVESRVRNALKLVDDTSQHLDGVLKGLVETVHDHKHDSLYRVPSSGFLRGWPNLGVWSIGGTDVLSTASAGLILGLRKPNRGEMHGVPIGELTHEWGGNLLWLSVALTPTMPGVPTFDLANVRAEAVNYVAAPYITSRFGSDVGLDLGLLLLGVGTDLGVLSALSGIVSEGYAGTMFRLRSSSAFHAARAFHALHEHGATPPQLRHELSSVLSRESTSRLLSRGGLLIRNRCVHYLANDPAIAFNASMPMFGIVESVYPGQTFAGHSRDVDDFIEASMRLFVEAWPSPGRT